MRPQREVTRKTESAYFVSTQTEARQPFFRHERWARLLISTLEHYGKSNFGLHAWVIMPDHLHLLISPSESLEKAVQLIKGGFSFRAKRGLDWPGSIWQEGFTDHRIRDARDWSRHIEYIRLNPVKASLVLESGSYPYIGYPAPNFPQGLKPPELISGHYDVRAEARTLQDLRQVDIRAEANTLLKVNQVDVQAEAPSLHGLK